MRIVHICCANFYRDNCGYQENILPKYHARLGFETFVLASVENRDMENNKNFYDIPRTYEVDGYKVIRIAYRFGKIGRYMRVYQDLYSNLERINPDIIFVHGLQFVDIRKVKKYIKFHNNVKLYIDNHADYFNGGKNWISKNVFHKFIWKSGAQVIEPHCDKFYGVTPIRCDYLHDIYGINRDKIELLVMGADDEKINFEQKNQIKQQIRNQLDIEQNDFVFTTGGRLVDRKNIPELLQAIINLNNRYKNIKLIMFGSMSDEIKEQITPLLVNSCIKYIGWIPSDKVYDYFLTSDVGIFPGTHSVLWEQAVGTGLPCIFKHWDGMHHVDVGGNCIFLQNSTVNEIEEVVANLMDNKEYYLKLKENSIRKGINQFSYLSIANKSIENSGR